MLKNISIILTILLLFFTNIAGAEENTVESATFKKIWQKFSDVSNEAIEYAAQPEGKTSKTFLEFLTLREPKYVRLVKEAQAILGSSEAQREFDTLDELYLQNRDLEEKIVELKRKRISAPESSHNPLTDTQKDIDKKIDNYQNRIANNKAAILNLQIEIAKILNHSGLHISQEELHYFLISAEGDELIRLMTIAENMKKIQQVIENELQADKNNAQLAKMYAGMYLVSLDSYNHAHDTAIEKIGNYRKKLEEISRQAMQNYNDAKTLRDNVGEPDKANAEANIHINEKTMEVAAMYDSLLNRRVKNLQTSKLALKPKIDLARNTYQTIVNGATLINLVNNGSNEYSLLINFEMPELKTIYDSAMLNAFTEIAEKIKLEK